MNVAIDQVRSMFEELNRPSAARLKTALRARGLAYDPKDVDTVVSRSTEKQQQAPVYKYTGKITATAPNSRWAIDTINLTSRPSKSYRYIVVAQDIFTRRLFAKASERVSPEAVARIFEGFVAEHGVPRELNSDGGAEYTSRAFTDVLERLGIHHRVKSPQDKNAIATLDSAIGRYKRALLIGPGDWSERVQQVANGMNRAPHSHLMESAPNDVDENDELVFELKKRAAEDMAHNSAAISRRKAALNNTRAFRTEVPQKGAFRRGHHATFGGEVHQVASVDGAAVTDAQGREFQTKFTRPVPAGSATVQTAAAAGGGSALVEDKQKRLLRPFAERLSARIGRGRTVTLTNASRYLGGLAGFAAATREANLNQKHVIARALRLFPDLFVVRTTDKRRAATVRAVDGAPPVTVGVSGQPLRRLRRITQPVVIPPRGPIDAFVF